MTTWVDDRLAAARLTRTGPLLEHRHRAWADVFTAPTNGEGVDAAGLQAAYLDEFTDLAAPDELATSADLACRLACIARAVT